MSLIVIMAEKANAARDIAAALGLKNDEAAGEFIHGINDDSEIVITYSQGHCLRLQEPEEMKPDFKKWDLSDLPIEFSDDVLKVIDPAAARRYGRIKTYLQKADFIVNAGDAGREGELIQRWIIKKSGVRKNIYRMWSSSMTKPALRKAYDNLLGGSEEDKKMLDDLYDAGAARAIMDKFTGYNYSRLISLTKTDGVTVNYGRCKSPLTHAIIERDNEIENFVKRPYSYIKVGIERSGEVFTGRVIGDDGKIRELTHEIAVEISSAISGEAAVLSIQRIEKTVNPPKPYDILTIQKKMSETYDYDADRTLDICQALYDKHKILSYPRTDSRYLSTDLKDQVKDSLAALKFGKFTDPVKSALPHEIPSRYFNDGKVTDHHALIPVVPDSGIEEEYIKLSEEERNVFDEIVFAYISLFLPAARVENSEVILDANGTKIEAKGKKVIDPGYTALRHDKAEEEQDDEISAIPDSLKQGDIVIIQSSEVVDTETKPKQHFTTSSLLDFMKIHNIGTGATRDGIIKELTERKKRNPDSTVIKKGKYFIATDFGKQMDSLIPEELKSIEYLSKMDTRLKAIEDGKLSKDEFLKVMKKDFDFWYCEMTSHREIRMRSGTLSEFDCPFCNEKLLDKGWGYVCPNWKRDGSGCNFSIAKTVAGKKLGDKVIRELLETGKSSSQIKGFKSKAGKKFDAYLKCDIKEGKANITFDFERGK